MGSCRERIEAKWLADRYASKLAPQNAASAEAERAERLAQNARTIQETRVNILLLDMTPAEQEAVFSIVGREKPNSLGDPLMIEATLLRIRTEGWANICEALAGTTKREQELTREFLKSASAEERLGMVDGGAKIRACLAQAREKMFMEEE